jgi:heat shock protein HslJ
MEKLVSVLFISVLVLIPCLAGCFDSYSLIENVTWEMESYGDAGDLTKALDNADFTLYLDSKEGTFSGSIGVNSYFGKYRLTGSFLSFPDDTVAVTELYVSKEVQQQQEAYLHIFMNADKCEMVKGKLHITSGDQLIVYHKK